MIFNFSPVIIIQLFLTLFIFLSEKLYCHGLGESTLVKMLDGVKSIEDISKRISQNKKIVSYKFSKRRCSSGYVRSAGKSVTNCYIRIGFDNINNICDGDVLCTPTQEFYIPEQKRWVPAYQLKIGDKLFSASTELKTITHVELIKQSLIVYVLEIEKHHNFFVSKHCVLTHNTALPWQCSLIFSIPFGAGGGAAAGGQAGSFFGPAGIIGGVIIGGVLGWAAEKYANQDKLHFYEALFDIDAINAYLKENTGAKQSAPSTTPASAHNPNEDPEKEYDVHPSTPVGRKGEHPTPKVQKGIRKSTIIRGRKYSHHAIERMQERGITPSAVENAIKNDGVPNKVSGRVSYHDPSNDITAIVEADGEVVTVSYGKIL